MMTGKQAFLISTNKVSESVFTLYQQIAKATSSIGDTILLYHFKEHALTIPYDLNVLSYIFEDNILSEMGYTPISNSLLPGSNHFPVLKFYLENNSYTYYWLIEDDIIFNGDWKFFIDKITSLNNYDFITSNIETNDTDPEWKWWFSLSSPPRARRVRKLLKSFNPLYRISNDALKFIDKMLRTGWSGHHEVLLPTLLYNNKFNIIDFGGDGKFTPDGYENILYSKETYRWRPVFQSAGDEVNKLYHPVKTLVKKEKYKISFCIIVMNRLEQFSNTILQNIIDNKDYENLEFIILDYNSRDGLAQWCKENLQCYIETGKVIYYRTEQPTVFKHSHAKNVAFRLASGDIVCNINADHYTGKNFASYINYEFDKRGSIVLTPISEVNSNSKSLPKDLLGKVCVRKKDFLRVNGFDEGMVTYGFEDYDFINRLEMTGIKRVMLDKDEYCKYLSHSDLERFSLEEMYSSLYKILIHYISPSASNIIFMYDTGKFEMGKLVDYATYGSSDFRYSYLKRNYVFEYGIETLRWVNGDWVKVPNSKNILCLLVTGNKFELTPKKERYETIFDGVSATFYDISNLDLKEELLNFHYLFKNRSLLEHNLVNGKVCPNSGSFGQASVCKNFDINSIISIN